LINTNINIASKHSIEAPAAHPPSAGHGALHDLFFLVLLAILCRQQEIRLLEYMKQCCGRAVACIQGETSPYHLRRNPPYSPGRREWKNKVLQDPECCQFTKDMGQ
jgi:hypothetical protein